MKKQLGNQLSNQPSNQLSNQLSNVDEKLKTLLDDVGRTLSESMEAAPHKPAPPRREPEPVFRINSRDLFFLRSIGIDPTRQLRRRRGSH